MYGLIYGDVYSHYQRYRNQIEGLRMGISSLMTTVTLNLIEYKFGKQVIKEYQTKILINEYHIKFYQREPIHSWACTLADKLTFLDDSIFTRALPFAYTSKTERTLLKRVSGLVSMSHKDPESIRVAQSITFALYLVLQRRSKQHIKERMIHRYHYNLDEKIDSTKKENYVRIALQAFFLGKSFDEIIQIAFKRSSNNACIVSMAGCLAEAFYGMPHKHRQFVEKQLKHHPVYSDFSYFHHVLDAVKR